MVLPCVDNLPSINVAHMLSVLALVLCNATSLPGQSNPVFKTSENLTGNDTRFGVTSNSTIDSITVRSDTNTLADTLIVYKQKIDSLEQQIHREISELRENYARQAHKIVRRQQRLIAKIDSMSRKQLPCNDLMLKVDSARNRLSALKEHVDEKMDEIKSRANEVLNSANLPAAIRKDSRKVQEAINSVQIREVLDGRGHIQSNNLSNVLPGQSELGESLKQKLSVIQHEGLALTNTPINQRNLNETMLGKAGRNPPLKPFELDAGASEVRKIQQTPIDKLAEGELTKIESVKVVQAESKIEGAVSLGSEDALKSELERKAKAEMVDHFRSQQKQLRAAMERIAEYKQKYKQVANIADTRKGPSNCLSRKPVFDRLIPGIMFQVLRIDDYVNLDINPSAGLRLSPHLTGGLGWNQRISYDWSTRSFGSISTIFGPRMFGEYLFSRGFSPRAEIEMMNTRIPPGNTPGDPYRRMWVPGAFVGIKKQYKITNRLRGTALVMLRVLAPNGNRPYDQIVNARFGLEYHKKSANK